MLANISEKSSGEAVKAVPPRSEETARKKGLSGHFSLSVFALPAVEAKRYDGSHRQGSPRCITRRDAKTGSLKTIGYRNKGACISAICNIGKVAHVEEGLTIQMVGHEASREYRLRALRTTFTPFHKRQTGSTAQMIRSGFWTFNPRPIRRYTQGGKAAGAERACRISGDILCRR